MPSATVDAAVLSDVEQRLQDAGVLNIEVLDEGMYRMTLPRIALVWARWCSGGSVRCGLLGQLGCFM